MTGILFRKKTKKWQLFSGTVADYFRNGWQLKNGMGGRNAPDLALLIINVLYLQERQNLQLI